MEISAKTKYSAVIVLVREGVRYVADMPGQSHRTRQCSGSPPDRAVTNSDRHEPRGGAEIATDPSGTVGVSEAFDTEFV